MGLRKIVILGSFLIFFKTVAAQQPNDQCFNALTLTSVANYCSANAAFDNISAKDEGVLIHDYWLPHATMGGKDVWFKFTALAQGLSIEVSGNAAGGGTLEHPLVALYESDCKTYTLPAGDSFTSVGDVATFTRNGLIIGEEYYIRVSAANNNSGTFKLCVNNFNPPPKPGQDYIDAALLCSKETITETGIIGAGFDNRETRGTCLGQESNTAWYKWRAANNGTLVFTITPTTTTDDIDFVLYDLGITDDPFAINATNAIRCAAGHGVDNTTCPTEPIYYKTGLDFGEVDTSEPGGCGQGQNGKVKYIDMKQDHYYALLVSNFSNANNGFTIEFGGTGEFQQSNADFEVVKNGALCEPNQSYTFTNRSTNYSTLKWTFGKDASVSTSNLPGPHTITYVTSGTKTVVLEAITEQGCVTVASKTFDYDASVTPDPKIRLKQPVDFCISKTIDLETDNRPNVTYNWTGPDGFSASGSAISIPINGPDAAGEYTLIASQGICIADPVSITIPLLYKQPVAAFYTEPDVPVKLPNPIAIQFFNQSQDADAFLWDFGDGQTSIEENPIHEYQSEGEFDVKLTAIKSAICATSIVRGKYIIYEKNSIFIPNTFTPNGDNINDEFVVAMNNLVSYRIQIFNRWGKQVFETQNISEHWDGMYNGETLPIGVYYYTIEAVNLNGHSIKRSGAINIIR